MGPSSVHGVPACRGRGVRARGCCCLPPLQLIVLLLCTGCCCRAQVYNLSLAVDEGLPAGTLVGDIRAGLPEGSPGEGFFLSEEDGESPVLRDFAVDSETGIVRTLRALDRERRERYRFVAATLLGEVVQVDIRVRDVNDHSPAFPLRSLRMQVSELTPPGTSFRLPAARDPDTGEHGLRGYSLLMGGRGAPFIIRYGGTQQGSDGGTGELRDHLRDWSELEDSREEGIGKDERPPRVWEERTELGVIGGRNMENEGGEATLRVHSDGLEKGILPGEQPYSDQTNDELKKHTRDVRNDNTGVGDMENGQAERQAHRDNSFTSWQEYATDRQGYELSTEPYDYGAYGDTGRQDATGDSNEDLHMEGTGIDSRLHPLDLVLTQWLDREELDSYQLQVEAFDGGHPRRTGRLTVDIIVMDANDNPPTFDQTEYQGWAWENAPLGTPICTVHATDPDLGSNGEVSYSLRSGEGYFIVEGDSGIVRVSRPLDREQRGFHQLVVQASDGGDQPEVSSVLLTIRVLDVNDNSPHIHITLLTDNGRPEVSEGAHVGEYLARISVSDPDLESEEGPREQKDNVELKIQDNVRQVKKGYDKEAESLGSRQGQVDSTRDIRQKINRHQIKGDTGNMGKPKEQDSPDIDRKGGVRPVSNIEAGIQEEQHNSSHRTQAESILGIRRRNEELKHPLRNLDNSNQNMSARHREHNQQISSRSEMQQHVIVTLEGGEGFFSLRPVGPHLFFLCVEAPLDRETKDLYELKLLATDSGSPPLQSHKTLLLRITDLNDQPPYFTQPEGYQTSISEAASPGTGILKVNAQDMDEEGPNASITYSLKVGPDSLFFSIDPHTGVLSTTRVLDYEKESVLHVVVVATDHGSPPLSSSSQVTILVEDINDNEPVFFQQFYNVTLQEHTTVGQCFLQVKATDADSGLFGHICYSVYDGFHDSKESQKFSIDRETGQICVRQDINREGEPGSYDLLVKAQDEGGLSAQAFVRIEIEDINDNAPTFEPTTYMASISSHAQPGTEILNVLASDRDGGSFGEVTYELIPGDLSSLFTVDSSTGIIYLISTLNHLEDARIFLSVSARDKGGLTSTVNASVTINILKTAVAPAIFEKNRYTFFIPEDAPKGSAVGTVKAREPANYVEPVSYKILSGNLNELFSINSQYGIIKTKQELDHETQPLVVLIVQSQMGNASVFSNTQVNISITDVNDNAPHFPVENERIIIYQHNQPGTALYVAQAKDPDSEFNGLISYSIASEKQDMFSIDPSLGILYLNSTLMMICEHILLIQAEDSGHPTLRSHLTLTISVEQLEEVKVLTFGNMVHHIEVSEGSPVNSRIIQVKAYIQGFQSISSKIVYTLNPVINSVTFGMHRSTGWIFLRRSLDYETTKTYNLKVFAKCIEHGEELTATTSVIINVLDENDNSPTFNQDFNFFTVEENPVPQGVIGTISAFDMDSGKNGQLSYFLLSEGSNFLISSTTGEIINCAALDREQKSYHQLTVLVTDHGSPRRNATTIVYIRVADLNDNKPYFPQVTSGKQLRIKVFETESEQVVANMFAKDPDDGRNGTVVHALTSDNHSGQFIINSTSGEIRTAQALSVNMRSYYQVTVTATDLGTPPLQDYAILNIEVIPSIKERSKLFPELQTYKVPENVKPGQIIASLKPYDHTFSLNRKLHYHINDEDHGHFLMESSTGEIYLTKQLDYETKSQYVLSISIQDNNESPPQNHSSFIKLDIVDTNDHSPLFHDSFIVIGVREDIPVGTHVYTFKAKDGDGSLQNSKVKYSLNADEISINPFIIDEWDGTLITAKELDRETMDSFVLTVIATDQVTNITHRRLGSLTARIVIQDVNDNSPYFVSLPVASVMEDAEIGSLIHHIAAEDPDNGRNGKITFRILDGNSKQAFWLDETTGWLTLCSPVDRELQSLYVLTILAFDDGSPVLSTTQTMTVTVIDVNDESPKFLKPLYEATVPENREPGFYVIRIEAVDSDSGINSMLAYQIVPGPAHGLFRINPHTGELVTAAIFDREKQEHIFLKVVVTDGGAPTLSSTATIMCTVLDENDSTPEFLHPSVEIHIPENQELGIIHKALALDKDSGNNGIVHFQIIGGNTGEYFAMNNTSGELWATRSLDREDVSNFTIILECYDLGSPRRSSTAKLQIKILDQNDNPPTFSKSQYRTSVKEDLTIGSNVLNLSASDTDEGLNGEIIYSLIDDTQGVFTINCTTGSIVTTKALDRELKQQFAFRVVASDCSTHGPKSTTVKVLVNVEDVNDNSPLFSDDLVHVFVSPKILVNQTVATVHASDVDLGLNGTVVYNLVEEDSLFQINRETGDIILQMPLPSDSFKSVALKVEASDLGTPARIATCLVIIDIQDLEQEIVFGHNLYKATILENSVPGTSVLTVWAQHYKPKGEAIHYYILSGNEEEAFRLNNVTGELTVKEPSSLDFEVRNKINLVVSAETSTFVTYCTVRISIQDINDSPPVFEKSHHIVSVLEGQAYNIFITQVFAADADSGINGQIDYSIIGGNENTAFVIDPQHGILSTNAILDREIKSSYRLGLQASDRGSPSLSATSEVLVLVSDINDNAPTIPPLETVSVAEDVAPGYTVTRVSANDVDLQPVLLYSFTKDGNPGQKFAIDRHTGVVTLIAPLDYEETSQYNLRIQTSDLIHQSEAELTIKILDENDNPPVFTQDSYKVTVPELTAPGTFIISVSATDKDSMLFGPISYKILAPSKGFTIHPASGSIHTNMPVEIKDKRTVLHILIEAEDSGNPPLASTASLEILIHDVNNYAPKFSEEVYRISVTEDTPVGDAVLTFTATDLDWTHENAYIDYSIVSGNTQNLFYVESSGVYSRTPFVVVGKLIINNVLDYEIAPNHKLVLVASDQGFPSLNSSVTVFISIIDSNDNPPIFGNMEHHVSIREHHPVNSDVTSIIATDCDTGDNGVITYSIASGNDEGYFTIREQDGTIILLRELDYEEIMSFTLTVQATDGWGNRRNVAFSELFINVLDDNDFPPKFPFHSLSCSLRENVPSFTPVCSVYAIDLDSGPFGVLSYSILTVCLNDHTNQDTFFIDSLTGNIYTKHSIDYETQKKYCLVVQVKDKSESTSSVLVYVDIEGEDEYQPIFYKNQYIFDLPKENNPGQEVGKVEASDDDGGLDGIIEYFLDRPSQFFSVNITNGIIYLTRSVHKQRSSIKKNDEVIELFVQARSPKFDSKTTTCNVQVNISSALETYPGMSANILSISFSISFVVFLLLAISFIGIILRYKRKDVVNACGIKDTDIPAFPNSNGKDCISDEGPKYENIKSIVAPDTSEWLGLVGIREKKDTGNKCRNSDSSGHGSTEGETAEDEEIKMINEYPLRKESSSVLTERASRVPDSGIPRESDLLSCESDETDVVIGTESTESIVNIKDENEEEGHNRQFSCEKELPKAHLNSERLEKDNTTIPDTKQDYIYIPTSYDSRYGSLASLVASDEDLRGSYNWDYLLSWEPRFQTLSSVFCDIGKLKDEKMSRHGIPKQKKPLIFPPPLITSVAQPGIRAVPPRMPTILSGQPFLKYPRSPFFTNLACQSSTMSPTFSPSLSMLTVHTPSTSPPDTIISGTSAPTLSEELLIQQEFQV
ncbi:protocadherin-23 [Pelobates cultripes]|uniref:Protocadherin-23 n=1 Tax=Pelobates cultripes TaxID=61616 RepID=A0AAD1SKX4_PELCU|nr:protocadherin-23 [Pelobates cultripes]